MERAAVRSTADEQQKSYCGVPPTHKALETLRGRNLLLILKWVMWLTWCRVLKSVLTWNYRTRVAPSLSLSTKPNLFFSPPCRAGSWSAERGRPSVDGEAVLSHLYWLQGQYCLTRGSTVSTERGNHRQRWTSHFCNLWQSSWAQAKLRRAQALQYLPLRDEYTFWEDLGSESQSPGRLMIGALEQLSECSKPQDLTRDDVGTETDSALGNRTGNCSSKETFTSSGTATSSQSSLFLPHPCCRKSACLYGTMKGKLEHKAPLPPPATI